MDRRARDCVSQEYLDSQEAVEELKSVIIGQKDKSSSAVDGEDGVLEVRDREKPDIKVRSRESNVVVVLRPADRFREEESLERPVLTVGRIFSGLDRIRTAPDFDPPIGGML